MQYKMHFIWATKINYGINIASRPLIWAGGGGWTTYNRIKGGRPKIVIVMVHKIVIVGSCQQKIMIVWWQNIVIMVVEVWQNK